MIWYCMNLPFFWQFRTIFFFFKELFGILERYGIRDKLGNRGGQWSVTIKESFFLMLNHRANHFCRRYFSGDSLIHLL